MICSFVMVLNERRWIYQVKSKVEQMTLENLLKLKMNEDLPYSILTQQESLSSSHSHCCIPARC